VQIDEYGEQDCILMEFMGASSAVYKKVGQLELRLYLFASNSSPTGAAAGRAAIAFFHGGRWANGSVAQFARHCQYLATRGMVGITVDYRIKKRHGVDPFACIADAKSAMRWIRRHATELGINPQKIAAGGGSAGGHIAACAATIAQLDEPTEDLTISSVPDALVLFNPVLDTTGFSSVLERFGERAVSASPIHHITEGLPPTIIFHGTADATVPYANTHSFAEKMKAHGNRCELIPFEGRDHGFFRYQPGKYEDYHRTLALTDEFLVSLRYIHPYPYAIAI